MRKLLVVAVLALVSALLISGASAGTKQGGGTGAAERASTSEVLRKGLRNKGIVRHLKALQAIAKANGGNRAAGTPGYEASVDYVARRLKKYGWKVRVEPFDFIAYTKNGPSTFERTAPSPTSYVEDTDYSTMEYSGSGDVTAELVAVDLTLPPSAEPSSTSGCEATDFDGIDVTGRIALMQRGTCDFGTKVRNAEAAGAVGAVLFNEGQEGRRERLSGTLGDPVGIPALGTGFALGEELANGAVNGATGTTVHIRTDTTSEPRTTENVIAETRSGNRDDVVMAGGHLDSVEAGPGINDNGSGSAALLELARQVSKRDVEPKNRLRFAWFGAEETGLKGSTAYVSGLTEAQHARIALYLNFDMLASPNYARLIYDGNASKFEADPPDGSGAIERTFARYFSRQGLDSGQTAFDGRSDYGPFIDVGIPSGGLFSGAEEIKTPAEQAAYGGTEGEALDACYHKACDGLGNVNRRALREMSDAVAHAVAVYSQKLKFIPRPRTDPASELRRVKRTGSASEYLGGALRK